MSIVFERFYTHAQQLLLEDESIVDQNVWYNREAKNEPKYLLLEISARGIEDINLWSRPYEERGFVEVMPYGELAYYFKALHPNFSEEDVEEVIEFYIEHDSWPE